MPSRRFLTAQASPSDLTQDLRPQDTAFITGALSTTSLLSSFWANRVTFLKEGQNAFNHPDIAKRIDPDYRRDQAMRIAAELGADEEPTGRYSISVRLTANFDQIRTENGQTIDTNPAGP